ncbi:hypothetical protein ACH4F6_35400 [Streptomyces sp. NPDC017936]|uniref:hypothetical protein n=1 Tax=Streptomyces sp. NPDC017936 TaxID=3365016 RepID=UPI003790056B
MYTNELQRFRSAELLRRAERERLAREVLRGRRAARREARREAAVRAARAAGSEPHTGRPRRPRSARTA